MNEKESILMSKVNQMSSRISECFVILTDIQTKISVILKQEKGKDTDDTEKSILTGESELCKSLDQNLHSILALQHRMIELLERIEN